MAEKVTLLTDYETSIKQYILDRVQEEFPEMLGGAASPVFDTVINPLVEILKPIIDGITRASLMSDISNAENMTVEDLDTLGVNNYGVLRKSGTKASGILYVIIEKAVMEASTNPFVIGKLTVEHEGKRYMSTDNTIILDSVSDTTTYIGTVLPGSKSSY